MTMLTTSQWLCAVLGALLVGISKTGISGLSILAVALFAEVFPSSKQASGLVLPLLIFADVIAVLSYRAHTQWRTLWKVFPWTAVGVLLGYFALDRISDRNTRWLIGGIIVSLSALSYWKRRYARVPDAVAPEQSEVFSPVPARGPGLAAAAVGILAGFVTLIANAAGPLMAVYLVSMRLPKMQYVGAAAMFFMLLNLFKVPFMMNLGLVTEASFKLNLLLLPPVLVGTWLGRRLLKRIDQRLFENLVLALSAAAGLLLLR